MKKNKLYFFSLVCLILLLSGCVKKDENKSQSDFRIIVDHTGREVKIPRKINRVVIGSMIPLPSAYCLFTGSAEKIIGMYPSSMAAAKNSFLAKVYPEITKAETSFVSNGVVNAEELLKLKPDVVLYPSANEEERLIYEKAGIPAVGFAVNLSGFNTIETFSDWISLLGKVFGDTGRADAIIEEGRLVHKMISEKTVELSDRPKVLIIMNYDDSNLTVAGNNFFSEYWIPTAGGINVASEVKGQAKVSMEQIYKWNPDIIFISNFSPHLAQDLLDNQIEGTDWSLVKAVQEKKVYKFPLGMYRWFPPSSDAPLSLMWLAKKIQPEIFSDLDVDKKIQDYYNKYYNITLTQQDLLEIYNPSRGASGK